MPKHSPYCYTHKQSVEQAKSQAKAEGQDALEMFTTKEQDPSSMAFRKLIMDFEAACPPRGRGRARAKFGWATLVEEWKAATSESKQHKRKMMDYIDFYVYHTQKRLKSSDEANALWYEAIKDPNVYKDHKGKSDSGMAEVRVEVLKGDYRQDVEKLEYLKKMSVELEKVKKPTEETVDVLMEKATKDHIGRDHAYFKDFRAAQSFAEKYEEPLALLGKNGKAVVRLSMDEDDKKMDKEAAEKNPKNAAKMAAQLIAAKTSAINSVSMAWREEWKASLRLVVTKVKSSVMTIQKTLVWLRGIL